MTAQLERMISEQLNNLVTSLSPKDQEATLSTLKRIFDNIIQHPNDDKYRQIKLTSKTFASKVWQYPAGEELMKMSGWVVEGDHVRLIDGSCVQIVSQLLKSLLSSSATGVAPFPDDEFQVLIKALYNGDITCIQKLLKVSHISPNGRIYSESGSSLNLLKAATIAQQLDIVKLLLTDYSMDPYVVSMIGISWPFIVNIFHYAPQSFIIAIMKHCGVKTDFKTTEGFSLLYIAVMYNCFDVVSFLLEECSGIDVNVTTDDDYLDTPLHLAYLCGHTQIAQYLIQHGADVYAVDNDGHTPYEYIDGEPNAIKNSEHMQSFRKIHHIPYSIEHCYYMKLINFGIDAAKEAVSLTMEQFPSLKEDGPTQPHQDIDHASALKEFTQYITYSTHRSTDDSRKQPPSEQSEVQGEQAKISTDHPWRKPLSLLQRAHVLF